MWQSRVLTASHPVLRLSWYQFGASWQSLCCWFVRNPGTDRSVAEAWYLLAILRLPMSNLAMLYCTLVVGGRSARQNETALIGLPSEPSVSKETFEPFSCPISAGHSLMQLIPVLCLKFGKIEVRQSLYWSWFDVSPGSWLSRPSRRFERKPHHALVWEYTHSPNPRWDTETSGGALHRRRSQRATNQQSNWRTAPKRESSVWTRALNEGSGTTWGKERWKPPPKLPENTDRTYTFCIWLFEYTSLLKRRVGKTKSSPQCL